MKITFQKKLTLSFLIIFTAFTLGIVVFEQQRAKRYKTEALQEKLDAYADEVSRYMQLHGNWAPMDTLLALMPSNLRLTLIDRQGKVAFDNAFSNLSSLDNHSRRPEVADAMKNGSGTFVRKSASNSQPYLYYAKDNGNAIIVRVALPYDIQVQSFLKPDNAFLYFIIALFLVGFAFIFYVGGHFGKSVKHLRDFSLAINYGKDEIDIPEFPKDEFGEIGQQLARDFNRIKESENQLAQEREKLLLHIQTSAEGICFLNPDRTVAFYNGLFLQYFNMISTDTLAVDKAILDNASLAGVVEFLDERDRDNYYETRINRSGKEFLLRLNVFEDSSFEIILTDVTTKEKTQRLKQEMTGNIAHELRTPVTSIRGFLEIVLDNEPGEEKAREYIRRAYSQTKVLSELISDMSLLTRMDGKQDSFDRSVVDVEKLMDRVRSDISEAIAEKHVTFHYDLPKGLSVKVNENLAYSVFRNLTDNVIRHAGEGVEVFVKVYDVKDGLAYFSFADTGKGIDNEWHLNRLFERFYRVGEGRTRDTGGSGLGLSIVKNAVLFHGGTITARNRSGGGLEFLFTLPVGS